MSELKHHGIQGQKWGKRNGPPYPLKYGDHSTAEKKANPKSEIGGSSDKEFLRSYHNRLNQEYEANLPKESNSPDKRLTPEQRKKIRNIAIGVGATAGLAVGMYFAYKYHAIDKISEVLKKGQNTSNYDFGKYVEESIDETTFVIKKDSIIHRASFYKDVDYSSAKNPLYVSYDKKDVVTYDIFLQKWNGNGTESKYDVTFKALKDIRVPTKAKAQEIFEELWNKDPKYREQIRDQLIDTLKNNPFYKNLPESSLKNYANDMLEEDPFNRAIWSIVKNGEDTKKLIGKLQEQGYDAILDYHDINDGLSTSPLIIFDPSSSLAKQGEKLVDKVMAKKMLIALKNEGITSLPVQDLKIDDILNALKLGQLLAA